MKPLKVALCDDNATERAFFYNMCKRIKEQENIQIRLKEYATGEALLFDMDDPLTMNVVDIVLLDIAMPGRNGIEVADQLRKMGYQGSIIFITKSKNYWESAFDVKALNYITKNQENVEDRFVRTFRTAIEEAMKRRGKALLFSSFDETRQIEVRTISHFLVKDHLMRVYYGENVFEFTSSLSKIKELLFEDKNFMQVNRNTIVSLSHIEKINKNVLMMVNGHEIPVAVRKMKDLKKIIVQNMLKE